MADSRRYIKEHGNQCSTDSSVLVLYNNFNGRLTYNDNHLVKLYFVKLFTTLSRKLVWCGSVPLI